VRGAVEAEGSGRVAGIVLVTDGRVTAGEGLQSAGAYLREKGIPVHAVGVGDPTPTKNLRVTAILTSERAFTGDSIVADVRIEEEGLDGETARVELLDTFEPEGEPARAPVRIDTQETSFTGGRREAVVSFRFEPEGVGRHLLTARIEPRPEETFTDDNERSAAVVVVKEASKVLLIAGGPSYEYRFLKNLLKRDARIHVAAWLMSADADYPQEGNTSLKKLPDTTKDLFHYDVVILMDPNPEGFPAGFPDLVEKFVGKHRGGLVLSAGSKFAPSFFEAASAAPIRNMLPVLVNAGDVRETLGRGDFYEREWAIEALPAALDHAATRLSSQIDRNRDRWAEIAGIYWSFPARKAKPGATVLFTHPDPALAREGEPRPLIAIQFYEGGRVLWCGIDSVWRWRSTAEEVYDSFWVQSIRYLTEGRLLGDRRRLLQTDSDAYDLGEAVRVSAFLSDENFNPVASAEEIAVVEDPDGAATELRLDPDPSAPGWFRGVFVPRTLGAFRLRLKGPSGAPGPGLPASPGSGQAEKVVSVEPPAVEFDVPRLDEEALRELALLTSGSYSTIAEAGSVPDRILDRRQTIVTTDEPIPLWDNSFSMSLLGLLLTLEWVFRKVNRLL
ncbi:MAG TPA: vWA domain-containing protein, partial [Planctomycetota bacterium]|nr:vWA domain-containing protein [Planctomycetota bacterium]